MLALTACVVDCLCGLLVWFACVVCVCPFTAILVVWITNKKKSNLFQKKKKIFKV